MNCAGLLDQVLTHNIEEPADWVQSLSVSVIKACFPILYILQRTEKLWYFLVIIPMCRLCTKLALHVQMNTFWEMSSMFVIPSNVTPHPHTLYLACIRYRIGKQFWTVSPWSTQMVGRMPTVQAMVIFCCHWPEIFLNWNFYLDKNVLLRSILYI
jgi:hypothetical protein